ncbi:DUF1102 domain-containing protein [Halovivax limisalsi]|uniref:DUF1102 domain-containing protein n=1 Tax=Halovivax limisalsi TaxID=1453760 RepID=UPI001FFCC48E|nr:DUF1102 domain-containing protein [Halovivax limisalsi]
MKRRNFLIGAGSASLGGGAIVGSGAFSRVESDRAVSIAVAEDPNAYLGLDKCDSPNGSYAHLDDNGHLKIYMDEDNPTRDSTPLGAGINSNSTSYFHNVFQICNQGKESACIWIQDDDNWPTYEGDRRVEFYLGADDEASIVGEGNAVSLDVGECICVGIRTKSYGLEEGDMLLDALDNDVTIVADVDGDCSDDGGEEPPECTEPKEKTWSDLVDEEEGGGPVVLMGLDSEDGAGTGGHGDPADHASMVESILDDVTNGGDGILVLGGDPDASGSLVDDYWEGDLGNAPNVDETVTFVSESSEIESVDFDGYAMLGIPSSCFEITAGVTNAQNAAIKSRADDISDFVNNGGGLLGKTQEDLDEPWAYADPFGELQNREMGWNQYDSVTVEQAGLDMGLTQNGMSGWCCYHETFPEYPDFFDVLLTRDDGGLGDGEAGAIGGSAVVIPRVVSFEATGASIVEVGDTQSYAVSLSNEGEESEGEVEIQVDDPDGVVVADSLPDDPFELVDGYDGSYEFSLECTDPGVHEIGLSVVGTDGSEITSIVVDVECIPADPGLC